MRCSLVSRQHRRRANSLILVADGRTCSPTSGRAWSRCRIGARAHDRIAWFDPAVALLLGGNLAITGFRLVRRAAGGLLDEEDSDLLGRWSKRSTRARACIIRIHRLRAIRAGRYTHVDAHLVLPSTGPSSKRTRRRMPSSAKSKTRATSRERSSFTAIPVGASSVRHVIWRIARSAGALSFHDRH